ncbi:MAG: hypothetical protein GXP62_09155, partial [Oligoflexia bacterium]|nr:hypothetical protein [Oligoflexia bacterium]
MPAPAVHIFPGVLACERALLGIVDGLLPPSGRDLKTLARPVVVVVPSRSLARHVVALLVRHRGCALVGLQVQTLSALATQLLAQAGIATAQDDALLDVLVRRRAAASSPLRDALGTLENGYGAVLRPVTTLLDAGFVAETDAVALAGLIQSLPDTAATAEQRLRALALVTVAGQAQSDLAALGQLRHPDGLRRAARLLGQKGAKLAASAVLVHGLADPSGAELELVDALHRHADATVLAVAPPDLALLVRSEADVEASDAGLARVIDRLGTPPTVDPRTVQAPALRLLAAPGPTAEARAVVRQIQALLSDASSPTGRCSPEDIYIVARDMGARAHLLRPELERLGLPWSGVGAQAPPGPALRKVRALLDLLSLGADLGVDAWLDAVAVLPGVPLRALPTLRAALAVLGCTVLGDVGALLVDDLLGDGSSLPLPTRAGIQQRDAVDGGDQWDRDGVDGDGVAGAAVRMRVGRALLESAVAAAAGLLADLQLDHSRALARWGSDIARAAHDWLGWGDPDAAWRALQAALAGLGQRAPAEMSLDRAEARLVLGPALDGAAATDIG